MGQQTIPGLQNIMAFEIIVGKGENAGNQDSSFDRDFLFVLYTNTVIWDM